MSTSKMQLTSELGTDWWNDSCAIQELEEAVKEGATGATSNPVIVFNAVHSDPTRWMPVLEDLIQNTPGQTEDEIAWRLIEKLGVAAARLLRPVYEATDGVRGYLSMQVNPKFYPSAEKMLEQAKHLSSLAPNIAIKAPTTETGIQAMEEMTACGIRVNATVSFSVSQAVAAAEAIQRGLERAKAYGQEPTKIHPYVTIMVGRVDDHLRRVREAEQIDVDPSVLDWAGVAVFKNAYQEFKRRDFKANLLAAAYRNEHQWLELIGENVLQTMPYKWWKKFNDSHFYPTHKIEEPIDSSILKRLQEKFQDFNRAYEPGALKPEEFLHYGATLHTLHQFLGGYEDLLHLVRNRMLPTA